MIARDLELLGVVRKLNGEMGVIVAKLLDELIDGQLSALKLRELSAILRDLAAAVDNRADEIEDDRDRPVRIIDQSN